MRIREKDKEDVKKAIVKILKENGDTGFNLSEIARKIEKAPPTVLNYVKELVKEGRVEIIDKKSMKLVKLL
jgi:Mn-dependent DtxR family transcriptional regulator